MTPIFGAYLRMSWTRSFLIIFLEFEISTFRDWEIQFQEKEKYVDQNWETHAQRTPIFGAYIYLRMCWTGSSPISFRDGFSDELHPTRFYWSAKSHRWGASFAHDVFFSQILVVALTEPTFLEFEIKRQTLPEAQRTQKLTLWVRLNLETTWHH